MEKDVSDDELKQKMQAFIEKLKPKENAKNLEKVPIRQASLLQIRTDTKALILDVNSHPFKGIVSRYKTLNLSGRKGDLARQELLDKNLVEQAEVKLGKYRPVKFLVLTSLGVEYLKNLGIETDLWGSIGRVGFRHRLYQVLCANSLKKLGYETHVEKTIEGRRIDVLATKGDKSLAIEVQLNSDLDVDKILEIQNRFDDLLVLCDDEELLDGLTSILNEVGCHSTQTMLINQFLNNLIVNKHGNNLHTKNKTKPIPDSLEKDGIKGKI